MFSSESRSVKCIQSTLCRIQLRTAWHHYESSSFLIPDCNIFHLYL